MDPSSSSTSGSSEYDFARICRSCRKEDYYSQTIFDSVGSNGIRLDEMLASCVHKQVGSEGWMFMLLFISTVEWGEFESHHSRTAA